MAVRALFAGVIFRRADLAVRAMVGFALVGPPHPESHRAMLSVLQCPLAFAVVRRRITLPVFTESTRPHPSVSLGTGAFTAGTVTAVMTVRAALAGAVSGRAQFSIRAMTGITFIAV